MAAFVFNTGKGRVTELHNRVKVNDPAASVLRVIPLSQSGTEAQGQDLATMAAIEADANFAERTTGGWVRKSLTDATLAVINIDNANNRTSVAVPLILWTAPAAANNTTGLVICYDASGADADAVLLPLVHLDFAVTTDGNDVQLNAGDYFWAT